MRRAPRERSDPGRPESLIGFLDRLEEMCGPAEVPELCMRFLDLTRVSGCARAYPGGRKALGRHRDLARWVYAWCAVLPEETVEQGH